jgi:hypothetical protein
MGGDGGTKGNERKFWTMHGIFTKEGSKHGDSGEKSRQKEKANADEVRHSKFRTCSLSGDPLTDKVVCCRLGHLYNKESVIRLLLERSNEGFNHIRSLKDVIELKFTRNPAYEERKNDSKEYLVISNNGQYMCPITMQEFSGNHSFMVIWTSGAVLSEKAIMQSNLELNQCPVTSVPFEKSDLIQIAPDEKKKKEMMATEETRRLEEKAAKKAAKKAKKMAASEGSSSSSSSSSTGGGDGGDGSSLSAADGSSGKSKKRKHKEAKAAKKSQIAEGIGAKKLAKAAQQTVTDEKSKNANYAALFAKPKKYEGAEKLQYMSGGFRGTLA